MSSLAFTAGAWLWDKYGKSVTDKAAGAVKGKWGEFKWKDAAEAYRAKIKKLYSSRRIKRDEVYRKLSLGHKENMLARIAAETFEKNEYFISKAELERLITDYVKNVPPHDTNEATDGGAILKAIEAQHGIFVERAYKVYSFSHLTFQEYFTAKYVVANAAKGTLKNLVKEHCVDRRWREVFLLTASLLPDATQFMADFWRGVNKVLGDDEHLRAVLAWAKKKSAKIDLRGSQLIRINYRSINLYYETKSFALALALVSAPDRALALALDLTLALALFLNRALDRAFDYDVALSCP